MRAFHTVPNPARSGSMWAKPKSGRLIIVTVWAVPRPRGRIPSATVPARSVPKRLNDHLAHFWGKMRTVRACLVLIIVLATAVLLSPGVRPEHREDHRYFIVGTITDEFGEALCGATVRAADIDKPSPDNNRTAVTDSSGGDRIQLHMHDDYDLEANVARQVHNVGDRILVTVEGSTPSAVITAQKNAGDPDGWGLKTVNLVAGGLQGSCLGFVQLALIGLGVVVAVVAVFGAVSLLRRADRRR